MTKITGLGGASLILLLVSITVPHRYDTIMAQAPAATATQNQGTRLDVGTTAGTGTGVVGQRLEAGDVLLRSSDPTQRLSNRINSRVQSRLNNRIDRDRDPESDTANAFEVAEVQARTPNRPR